jgi:hypothetical protein
MFQITTSEIQNSMAEIMAKRAFLPNAVPSSIMVESQMPNQYFKISVRLNSFYKVLPTPDQVKNIYQQTGQRGEGAKLLMFGSVQVIGDRVRVTTRIVRTETSEVLRASLGDGIATPEGLREAFSKALLGLNIAYVA